LGSVFFTVKTETSHSPNRSAKGPSGKIEPIFDPADIKRIKSMLERNPRNWALFVFGINTAFRASELVLIKIGHVVELREGDSFALREPKTGKYRRVTLNAYAVEAVQRCIAAHPNSQAGASLFWSHKTGRALLAGSLHKIVKGWCEEAGLAGRFGSHTLRKTWGYQQRVQHDEPLSLLTKAFGHSSEAQTLEYLCIQPDELQRLYQNKI
jgi:integrase|tara:strand:+ start:7218 stop:7847 length:630 start_codon:yes stop_codon:yes gene_type:complete